MTLAGKRILLIVGGGIAAYKSLDLIRRLRERGAAVRAVMTDAAQQFVTPLSVGALTADHVFTDLFDRQDEQDVGHIRLARDTDLVLVAPATADLMAKLANGLANDLASTVLHRHRPAGADGAGDEPEDVGAPGDAAQPRRPGARRGPLRRPGNGRDGGAQRGRRGPHGRAVGDRRGRRGAARPCATAARRAADHRHLRARPTSRSIRCATSPTARPASRATPSRRRWRRWAPTCNWFRDRWRSPIRPA